MRLKPLKSLIYRQFRTSLALAAAAALLAISGCAGPAGPDLPRRHMVSAANPRAAEAGLEILRAGGSAVDAAIAVQAALTVVEPQSSGIGGGAFLLHYGKQSGSVEAWDGRETAPAAIRPDVFLRADGDARAFREAARGGQAVGVPGVLLMLADAHAAYGKLDWARLFGPAIALAEDGFEISPRLHASISRADGLKEFPLARAYFLTPDGAPRPVGTRLRNPELAATFRRIAQSGPAGFYRGEIADDIAHAVQNASLNPGTLAAADLEGYAAKKRDVLCRPYRAWRVCAMPPPTSGGIGVLQILGMLERFDLSRMQPGAAQTIHLFAEAARLAYADRAVHVGDPDHVDVPTEGLVDPDYLARRSGAISAVGAIGTVTAGRPPGMSSSALPVRGGTAAWPSTSHVSAIDAAGNAVSMTASIERPFGSHVMVRGFLLNNELTDFAFRPSRDGRRVSNAVAPGKRPMSSMAPVLVFGADGDLYAAVGSPGGPAIIAFVAKTLIGILDWRMDMQAAIDLPNVAVRGETVVLEDGTGAARHAEALRSLGHEVRVAPLTSGIQGIRVTGRGYDGGADRRREGVALGD